MLPAEENYLLLWSLLRQKMSPAGVLENIDYSAVAKDLGLDKAGTANVRFSRLKEDFSKMGFPGLPDKSGGNPYKPGSGAKPKVEKIKKTANPKARSAITKKPGATKGKCGKKGKSATEEENEDDEELKGEENEGGDDELLED